MPIPRLHSESVALRATTLLILRTTQLLQQGGRSVAAATSLAVLIYAAHNAFGAVVAYAGGHWIVRAGPRVVFGAGAVLYVLAYAGFAVSWASWLPLLIAFVVAGSGTGLAETAESTLVARLLPRACARYTHSRQFVTRAGRVLSLLCDPLPVVLFSLPTPLSVWCWRS